jgi:DNA-binding NtrC family response regulator
MQSDTHRRTILVGEDELEVRGYFEIVLKALGYSVELAQDGDEVLAYLESAKADVSAVLLDVMMPNRDGLDTLSRIKQIYPGLPVIMISGASSTPNVITAMKNGATDFLCKPILHDELRKAITRALEVRPADYIPPPRQPATSRAFSGKSPRMKAIQALTTQIGWSDAPVLIQGETGTGKEVLARDLHAQSRRAKKLFLKLNCAALPSELVESELFGYERGAFTGAFQKKAGMFEMADGGTILLDEIGDMDVRLQAKLLQVLQDQEFQRIGGKEPIKVDVRVIAATHRDLEKAILDRTFREDLYYRLNVINIHLPALRERSEDIVPLAEFLIKRHTSPDIPSPPLTPQLENAIVSHNWPGNVRELENFVRKFLVIRDSEMLANELLAKAVRKPADTMPPPAPVAADELQAKTGRRTNDPSPMPPPESVDEVQTKTGRPNVAPVDKQQDKTACRQNDPPAAGVTQIRFEPSHKAPLPILEHVTKAKEQAEAEAILAALNSTHWNRKRAAKLLHIDYKALLYRIKRLHLEDEPCEERALAAGR